jgi:NAD(P)-dependent dehydrogenase (short-subunit alcohol dehydrogenase family)
MGTSPPRPLDGRTIIVTGAAQGMGAATAQRLAADGARLVLVDRNEAVTEVAQRVDAVALVGDATSPELAAEAVALARSQPGRLWGLANVAGIHHAGDALSTSEEEWQQVLGVNMTAPWIWSRAVLPDLLEAGAGAIVIVASINSFFARPNSLVYTASKHGVMGLVRSLAVDYGRLGVRTNAICPGSVETEMLLDLIERFPHIRGEQLERTYSPRLGAPDDIASAVAYLIGDDAQYVNGSDLRVDGGRTGAI